MRYKKSAIIVGSTSDRKVAKGAKDALDYFGIPHDDYLASLDRTPERVDEIAGKLNRGVYAAAVTIGGMAFALAAALKAKAPTKPVYGVPVAGEGAPLAGMDALYSIVQRPQGTPVACVGINQAANAALLVVEWYAQLYPDSDLDVLLMRYRMEQNSKKGYDQKQFPWEESGK